MDVSKWQGRLEQTFMENGVVGGRLLDVIAHEQAYISYVTEKCHGYLVLTDSFFSFYIETLQLADSQRRHKGTTPSTQYYSPLLLSQAANFRTYRAAENLFLRGYPFSGYALLRDLKDRAIVLAAIANRMTNYRAVSGLDAVERRKEPFIVDDLYKMEEHRFREEKKVFNLMIRSKSGLDERHLRELRLWEKLFHWEVHGARLTGSLEAIDWAQGQIPLPILPKPDSTSVAMYVNRSNEIGWMLLRTFPFLQLEPAAFGKEWAQKWQILDESFRFAIEALGRLGKKVAPAFIHFIDRKFPFNPGGTHYQE